MNTAFVLALLVSCLLPLANATFPPKAKFKVKITVGKKPSLPHGLPPAPPLELAKYDPFEGQLPSVHGPIVPRQPLPPHEPAGYYDAPHDCGKTSPIPAEVPHPSGRGGLPADPTYRIAAPPPIPSPTQAVAPALGVGQTQTLIGSGPPIQFASAPPATGALPFTTSPTQIEQAGPPQGGIPATTRTLFIPATTQTPFVPATKTTFPAAAEDADTIHEVVESIRLLNVPIDEATARTMGQQELSNLFQQINTILGPNLDIVKSLVSNTIESHNKTRLSSILSGIQMPDDLAKRIAEMSPDAFNIIKGALGDAWVQADEIVSCIRESLYCRNLVFTLIREPQRFCSPSNTKCDDTTCKGGSTKLRKYMLAGFQMIDVSTQSPDTAHAAETSKTIYTDIDGCTNRFCLCRRLLSRLLSLCCGHE